MYNSDQIYLLIFLADQRGIEISTISCRFSLNSYSLARYFVNFSIKGPGLPYNNAFSASKYVFL